MPAVSAAQKRLMVAAAHTPGGYGGVPQSVGKKFMNDDEVPDWTAGFLSWALQEAAEPAHQEGSPKAAGIMYVAAPMVDGKLRVLLLKRSLDEDNYAGYWNFPGGGIDDGETALIAAVREASEEIGHTPDADNLKPIQSGSVYQLFRHYSDDTFDPKLNAEHTEALWAPIDALPKPLHPGVKNALAELATNGIPETVGDCELVGDANKGFKFMAKDGVPVGPFVNRDIALRAFELVSGKKLVLAMDKAGAKFTRPAGMGYDKISFRVKDVDGRLHLHEKLSHISKACVSPYLGSEIPDFEKLGLQPDKIYNLLRDPAELAKAAPTFNGIPLMIVHVPTSADDHQPDKIAGTTGTDAVFNAPYLDNSLSIWTAEGVDGVEDESQMELSCGYRYTPDMTPGTYEGDAYDGIMRDIIGNHVALVEEGRAGPDVVVGDHAIEQEETDMKVKPHSRTALRFEGMLAAHVLPKLAKDNAPKFMKHIHAGLAKVTRKGLMATDGKTIKPGVLKAIVVMAKDGLEDMLAPEAKAAGGAGPDDVIMKLLEHALEGGASETPEMDEMAPEEQGDPAAPKKKSLAEVLKARGMSDDDISGIESEMGSMDEAEESSEEDDEAAEAAADAAKDKAAKDKAAKDALEGKVDKKAMDAAIAKAVKGAEDKMKATQEARDFVRPYVGDVSMAHDSAGAVYEATLKSLGVDSNGVKDPAALRAILSVVPKPNAKTNDAPIALDSAAVKSLSERFPHAAKIGL